MTNQFNTPIQLLDRPTSPSTTIPVGFLGLYNKNSWMTYIYPGGGENDVVLDRVLDGFVPDVTAIQLLATDTVLEGFNKVQGTFNNVLLTGAVSGVGVYAGGKLRIQTTITLPLSITLPQHWIIVGDALNNPMGVPMSGDATIIDTGAVTFATVNATPGTFGTSGDAVIVTVNAKGLITAISSTPIIIAGNQNQLNQHHILVGDSSGFAADVSMSGEATIIDTGAVTLSNSAVIGKVLTGYVSAPGVVAATDSILQAIQKLNGNMGPILTLGSANQIHAVNNAGTALEYKTLSTSNTAVANDVGVTLTGANAIVINIPTSSSTVRGVLSTADWSTFNGKESVLTFSTGLTRTVNTITSDLSTGVVGGQSAIGGTGSGESLTLLSTTHGTKGSIIFGTLSSYNIATGIWDLKSKLIVTGSGTTSATNAFEVYNNTPTLSMNVRNDGLVITPRGISSPAATQSERFGETATSSLNGATSLGYGANAIGNATSDQGSVAIGYIALSRSQGIAIGAFAKDNATAQVANILIGRATGIGAASTGVGVNTIVGTSSTINAASVAAAATNNVLIGYNTAMELGNFNVNIGTVRNFTGTVNNSIAIGSSTGSASIMTFSNTILIGVSNVAVGIPTATNQCLIGSAVTIIHEVYFGNGVVAATPGTSTTLTVTGGSGTNNTGKALVLASGASTGDNILAGYIGFWTPDPGASGTTLQTKTEKMRITMDGRLYCTAIHNNAGSMTGTVNQYVGSGTYTPSPTATVNGSAPTMSLAQWIRVGNVVSVSGSFTFDPTTTNIQSSFELSLPIASDFTIVGNCAGTASCGVVVNTQGEVTGSVANNTAKVQFIIVDVASRVWSYHYNYLIL